MKNNLLNILFIVVLIGIAIYFYSQKIINSFGYKINNIKFNEFTLNKIVGTVTVSFFNLKIPDFLIKKLSLKIYVNDVFIDEVEQLTPTQSTSGNIDVNLNFSVKPKEFLKLQSLNLILTKSKTIRYSGYVVIHKYFTFKIPIEYKYIM